MLFAKPSTFNWNFSRNKLQFIDICVEECERLDLVPFNLTKKQFRLLLEISVKESVFIFSDQLYKQIDGMAMGSPLGPTFANLFMC